MNWIRQSFRESFVRRRPSKDGSGPLERKSSKETSGSKPPMWQQDETSVRNGTCRFSVKYFGCVEVFESRGMNVCEEALKVLRAQKRKPIKAVLYASGDGIRVVDAENKRGLLVDQTIEKVSFCAPDRNHDKGFAYICRDGATRRWMCHGFHATKESGERLSHAVGCAFAICLEKKQKRDHVVTVNGPVAHGQSSQSQPDLKLTRGQAKTSADKDLQPSETEPNFERNTPVRGSFKQASIAERLLDPQNVKVADPRPLPEKVSPNPHAVARPSANPELFERHGSLRRPSPKVPHTIESQEITRDGSFKRQFSLRLSELPSTINRQQQLGGVPGQRVSAIIEEDDNEHLHTHVTSQSHHMHRAETTACAGEWLALYDKSSPTKTNIALPPSRADQWLESTLIASKAKSGSPCFSTSSSGASHQPQQQPQHYSSVNENIAPISSAPDTIQSLQNTQQQPQTPVDIFGQPMFTAETAIKQLQQEEQQQSSSARSTPKQNGSLKIEDQFEAKWNMFGGSNSPNPFTSESKAVNI